MYNVADTKIKGGRAKNLFTNQDEKWHEKYSRPIRNFYTMTRVLDMEPGVDMTINLFLEKVRDRFVSTGKACDMDNYVYYCKQPRLGLHVETPGWLTF